jgi:D-3-phosphoglycerate dehydrogenase / 2-oxoglutarate reductase
MSELRVVITDYTFPDLAAEEAAARTAGAHLIPNHCGSSEEVEAAVAGANVVLVQFAQFTAKAAAALAPGATVIRYGVGYDNIDLAGAKAAGVQVGFVPDYCTDEVADHTAASALTLLRKLKMLDSSVRDGEWAVLKHCKPMKPLKETVYGFFGFGQIGRAVHLRLRSFGFRFMASDPALSASQAAELGVELVEADTLFPSSDIVSLHAPITKATDGFVNASRLALMQRHAVIVNCARGRLINENDLANALKSRQIGGAALDVFEVEPLPANSPLRDAPNLLFSPHAAWYSDAAISKLQQLVADDIRRALDGHPPRCPVPLP